MQSDDLSADRTLAGLGDKVVAGLAFMVAQTREDLRVYRTTFPGWVAELDTVIPILPTHGPRAPAIGLVADAAADRSREHP